MEGIRLIKQKDLMEGKQASALGNSSEISKRQSVHEEHTEQVDGQKSWLQELEQRSSQKSKKHEQRETYRKNREKDGFSPVADQRRLAGARKKLDSLFH